MSDDLSEYTQALASERMPLAPQEIRTFFITAATRGRRPIFRAVPMAQLFLDTLQRYRAQRKFLLHEFVLMRLLEELSLSRIQGLEARHLRVDRIESRSLDRSCG